MSARAFSVDTGLIVPQAAGTARTMLSAVGDANTFSLVTELRMAVQDVVVGLPFVFELIHVTAGGTTTAAPPTAVQTRGWPAFTSPYTITWNDTVEPSGITVMRRYRVPIGGAMVIQYPLGREPRVIAASNGFGIRVTNPTGGATLTATNGGIDCGFELEIT